MTKCVTLEILKTGIKWLIYVVYLTDSKLFVVYPCEFSHHNRLTHRH